MLVVTAELVRTHLVFLALRGRPAAHDDFLDRSVGRGHGEMCAERLGWLEARLAARGTRVVVADRSLRESV